MDTDWCSVELNVDYSLLKWFLEKKHERAIKDGKVDIGPQCEYLDKIDGRDTYRRYLYLSERNIHSLFTQNFGFANQSFGTGVFVGPEAHEDGRPQEDGVFPVRFEKYVTFYWAFWDLLKEQAKK
ncbi:hypothetical protein PRIPAC_90910 [Pristionchus pacificus]|uniref:Uncharacterized protein n=1 Tax=Pristionchus pacificus TaxID=54126 RepID=A0A2A6B5J4_PRIPA|nr:hypothetical protein PRIPAC_90910 [Pristionchus pacificus]|eukprot:PDM61149.1 hypothetical protein PRIPAC_50591 [Pristionchus pacificus]